MKSTTLKKYRKKRLILSKFIKKNSIFSLGEASNREIDSINILNATIKSMKRALKKFDGYPNIIKIDGQKIFNYNERTFFLKKERLKLRFNCICFNSSKSL